MFSSKICEVSLLICKEQNGPSSTLPRHRVLLPVSGVGWGLQRPHRWLRHCVTSRPGTGLGIITQSPRPTRLLFTEPKTVSPNTQHRQSQTKHLHFLNH